MSLDPSPTSEPDHAEADRLLGAQLRALLTRELRASDLASIDANDRVQLERLLGLRMLGLLEELDGHIGPMISERDLAALPPPTGPEETYGREDLERLVGLGLLRRWREAVRDAPAAS